MLVVEQWAELRRLHFVQGVSIKELARRFDVDVLKPPPMTGVMGQVALSAGSPAPVPVPIEQHVEERVHVIRGIRVMLDADLAALYGVSTGALNQAVARNARRFPADFAFRLRPEEVAALKSQSVISNVGRGGRRRSPPRAFSEQGVAMLSSVLQSERAIAVNILIMRTFVRLRAALGQSAELRRLIAELERRLDEHTEVLGEVIEAIRALSTPAVTHALGFRLPAARNEDEPADAGGRR